MMSNDQQLLARAKQLDTDALRSLHQQFYEMVARYIQFKVGDPQTVEDLCGEVFVRVLEGLRRGQGWRDSPRGWIMGIARHIVADHYRQRERRNEVQLNEQLASPEVTDPVHWVMQTERQHRLWQAIQQLTDEQRDVILLRFREGIDIRGVAKAINKSPSAVKSLQYRALQTLTELMRDLWVEGTQD